MAAPNEDENFSGSELLDSNDFLNLPQLDGDIEFSLLQPLQPRFSVEDHYGSVRLPINTAEHTGANISITTETSAFARSYTAAILTDDWPY